ncbi:peptidase M15B and M15C DD-carboxypeptidase VanY/endolysin [Cellulomonas gilvus ATCC 13127]|uniref:Peptidase M15B and M15C DD-carboxypeptidase VanY/endolysin n=2 Tax=Cellulomonas gilvus TaxID=11 RepID=F8A7W1_CELGA|nr:peptidase M15B and M15C DD-carboxypeptidase VanY/endolysin [Cellulomonas gilvus ATCC 13127]
MDSMTGITQRIADIRSNLATMSPAPAAAPSASARTFADALASAVTREVATAPPTTQTSVPTSVRNADGVPADLARYGNGRIPADALATVGSTGHRLWAPAAQAFEQLLAAARRDGVQIGITDSYRSYEAQVDVAARKGLYSQGGLAAVPGTSPHGWGLALDLGLGDRAQAWMRSHAGQFGFEEDTPREPWHWVYKR